MKLLKNLGWFLLAILSFLFIYGFIQGLATTSLALGASPYAVTLLYVALAGVYVYGIYKWYQKGPVRIEKSGFNRFIWLPALVWFLSLVVQFFLSNDPSVNQQIAIDLTLSQPLFSFFAVVIFAPLTEELIFRGMLARYLFPKHQRADRRPIVRLFDGEAERVAAVLRRRTWRLGRPQQRDACALDSAMCLQNRCVGAAVRG